MKKPTPPATATEIRAVKRQLINDSIERRRLVDRLIALVLADERARVEAEERNR
jgi:hypothetical protein